MSEENFLLSRIRACRYCADTPRGKPLPHEPRPVLRISATARIAICGQAPGTRVHASGTPFSDASGDRLRDWMGVTPDEFYNERRIAIVPMGFCFPGLDAKGADLPPRPECAPLWRLQVLAALPDIRLTLLVGSYAQRWHLKDAGADMTSTVRHWRRHLAQGSLPVPHPSWRNTGWLRKNPWFEADVLPVLRQNVRLQLNS